MVLLKKSSFYVRNNEISAISEHENSITMLLVDGRSSCIPAVDATNIDDLISWVRLASVIQISW